MELEFTCCMSKNFEVTDVKIYNTTKTVVAEFDKDGNLIKPNKYFKSGCATKSGYCKLEEYSLLEKIIMKIKGLIKCK